MEPKPPIWLLPAAGLGVGLALSLLALIPLLHSPRSATRPAPAAPPAKAPAPPPPAAAKPAPPAGGLPEGEVNNYQIEMDSLARQAKLNEEGGQQMREAGALDRSVELLQKSSQLISASECLRNQMRRGVPFYQGKATCNAAVPGGG